MNKPSSRRLAAPTFEEPFEMLNACHERIHRMLDLLARLRAHVREHGTDEQARQAARDVMRYFDIAAPEHHRDEELHVFPALLTQGDGLLVELVARLRSDHLLMEAQWRAAREVLARLAESEGEHSRIDAQDGDTLDIFASLYAGHIDAEERIAYPRASALIAGEGLHRMSRDMMARRGVRDPLP
jgi:hemerythrin-like domain-containing protein